MSTTITVLTRKGQLTVPIAIRQALGLKRGDKIRFILERDNVILTKSYSVVAQTAAALKSVKKPPTAIQLRKISERAIAESVISRSHS